MAASHLYQPRLQGKRKRYKQRTVTPQQAVRELVSYTLEGLLQGSAVWLTVSPYTAQLLDRACLGFPAGGTASAAETLTTLSALREGAMLKPASNKPLGSASRKRTRTSEEEPDPPEDGAPLRCPAAEGATEGGREAEEVSHAGGGEGEGEAALSSGGSSASEAESGGEEEEGEAEAEAEPPPAALQTRSAAGATSVKLTLEEALFCQRCLGNLRVWQEGAAQPCTLEELWEQCVARRRDFLPSYIAYQHFRSKGWVTRSGLQYGTDFVLYQKHPADCHSTLCVTVLDSRAPDVGWIDIESSNRLCAQVGKKLVLFYVELPELAKSTSTLAVLDEVKVEERLVRRWVPGSMELGQPA